MIRMIPHLWTNSNHNCAPRLAYSFLMKNTGMLALSDNVRRLKEYRGWTLIELAKRAGVSKSALGYLVSYKDENDRHPTMETVEAVAGAFDLQAWQLMVPDQPIELLVNQQLQHHLADYVVVGAEGRAAVDRITQVEVRIAGSEKLNPENIQKAG